MKECKWLATLKYNIASHFFALATHMWLLDESIGQQSVDCTPSSFPLSYSTFLLPWYPETRCCRSRASSLRGRCVPEGGCPAGGHTGSLRKNI